MIKIEIPLKVPSLNEYIDACRTNYHVGNRMKKEVQSDMGYFINQLPTFKKPIKIHFTWVEANAKRDYDNICYAKKFVLDALQQCGKLKNDNRKWVTGFTDSFAVGDDYKVILEIEEV